MGRDTGIAERLRDAGLRVVEVDGWRERGSSDFNPRGSVNHHTAGPSSGATPSLNLCINGRPDLAGPLCNVFQSREPDGRDIAYVVAAGRANHAGSGGWKGLSGNSSVYGLEIEHTGVHHFPSDRLDIAAAIHAAMFTGDPAYCCAHREWAPDRKIDVAEGVDDDDFRRRVADARKPPPPPPPPPSQEDGMFTLFYVQDGSDTGTYYVMTPWSIDKIAWEDGFNLDARSPGHYAVVVPSTRAWDIIRKNAPTYAVRQT